MTTPPVAPTPRTSTADTRPRDVLGLIAVILAAVAIVPALLVFLIGLIPEMNAIWWLGIVLIPIMGIAGVLALLLGIIGVIVAARRGGRFVLSIIGGVLGILLLLPIAAILFGPAA